MSSVFHAIFMELLGHGLLYFIISVMISLSRALSRIGISRWFDVRMKQGLPEGKVTAPAKVLSFLGNCAECRKPFSTHGYELIVETASVENPKSKDKRCDSVILCEKCYYTFNESLFWLAGIREIGCLANIIGAILAFLGFLIVKNEGLGVIGVLLLLLPSLVRFPAGKACEREETTLLIRHFPQTEHSKYVGSPFPWWEKPILLCTPSALAVVVNSDSPVQNLSLGTLRRVLLGEVQSWQEEGGSSAPINLYLPIGSWREWAVIEKELLAGAAPGKYTRLKYPTEVLMGLRADPSGIGLLSLLYVDLFGEGVRAISIDHQQCSVENSAYPFWMMPRWFSDHADAQSPLPPSEFCNSRKNEGGEKV